MSMQLTEEELAIVRKMETHIAKQMTRRYIARERIEASGMVPTARITIELLDPNGNVLIESIGVVRCVMDLGEASASTFLPTITKMFRVTSPLYSALGRWWNQAIDKMLEGSDDG